MCGIAGVVGRGSGEFHEATLRRMVATLHHRGPDDEGLWTDPACGIGLGHKRLAILDLSPAGHQPMASASRRLVLAFNGEIYNHARIREDLEKAGRAVHWRGHSDTETLLEGFEFWGVEETLGRTVGMFALALWDASERLLYLARDRFGEKPLYYGWAANSFLFASELKAIRAAGGFSNPVNRQALAMYFDRKYVPSPWSIYQDIYKLEPGTLLTIRAAAPRTPPSGPLSVGATYDSLAIRRWWSTDALMAAGRSPAFCSEGEALAALEAQLEETIRLQSLADVPVGSFLSGGVDSSAVTAFMQGQSSRPVKTFTVAFHEAGYDESAHAGAVARHLGTDHTEVRVTGEQARAIVPSLPSMFDEPFADSSQIPTHLVSRIAREHVTVALSGDGGDEVFGGYNRYLWAPRICGHARWMPGPVRNGLATGLGSVAGPWMQHLPTGFVRLNEKLLKLADALRNADSVLDMYRHLTGASTSPPDLVIGNEGCGTVPSALETSSLVAALASEDPRSMMMYLDTMTYLPDDILCKVDRAAMATSLETRVPFLDHRVVEIAWKMPEAMRFREGQGKWALRQLLYRRVPRALIERPKAGFAIPVGEWLRGPLRAWADSLLDEHRVRQGGYLDPGVVSQLWRTHKAGKRDVSALLWAILMFESWRETFDASGQEARERHEDRIVCQH